ncbi:hypothetical protein SDC9_173656 [bioreactor metagenome]|uniref:Uncharacterized protein n=1 Tax=bioreactor metagenome TaxID=1076179 RepID=A0A645GK43_9ZZZZ
MAGQQPDRVIDDHVATLVQPDLLHPRPQQGLSRLDGRMLEPADHDSGTISRPAGRRPRYRCRVRFAAAGGEDHLVGPRAQQSGQFLAGVLEQRPRRASGSVQCRRVSDQICVGGERIATHRTQWRGCGVIKIDRLRCESVANFDHECLSFRFNAVASCAKGS